MLTILEDNGNERVAAAKVVINDISWFFFETFTPNLDNQQLVAEKLLSEVPTELYYEECTVFGKTMRKSGTWTFELGIENGKNIPSWINEGLLEIDEFDEQTRDKSNFDWLPVCSTVFRLGSER